ncbi:uncharacterized protein LOC141705979 isoform X1 [Apium graveolens]|uniref:uncharacterized protein LOC141705979 isoform X1 n=1 Tax=Apium graveolens TaxID=4045 RepID=UPI003D78BF34
MLHITPVVYLLYMVTTRYHKPFTFFSSITYILLKVVNFSANLSPYQGPTMANFNTLNLLFLVLICAAQTTQGFSTRVVNPRPQNIHASAVLGNDLQVHGKEWIHSNARRLMIGSVAPTCTYNECRGCRFRCRAEQVPVEGNDPMNSAYHYKCICHR